MVITLEWRYIPRHFKNTPYTAVIYHGILTLEIVGLKLPRKFTIVIYCGIFITLPPGVHNTSFSSELTNGPNKIEWYITLGLKCVQGTNTLVYLAPS